MAEAAGDTARTPTVGLNAQRPGEWGGKKTGWKAGASLQVGSKNTEKFNMLRLAAAHVVTMVILRMDCQSWLLAFSMERRLYYNINATQALITANQCFDIPPQENTGPMVKKRGFYISFDFAPSCWDLQCITSEPFCFPFLVSLHFFCFLVNQA